jgi:hypothetical protein
LDSPEDLANFLYGGFASSQTWEMRGDRPKAMGKDFFSVFSLHLVDLWALVLIPTGFLVKDGSNLSDLILKPPHLNIVALS